MAVTALDIITSAMQNIGAIALGETPSAEEAIDGLSTLNSLVDQWNNEGMMLYTSSNNVFNFVAGKGVYTLGNGGDFNIPRPLIINECYTRDSIGNDYPIYVTDDIHEYAQITAKYTNSTLPLIVLDGGEYPLKNLTFWPIPSSGSFRFVIWSSIVLSAFANLTDTISLPQGYRPALEFNLAVYLAPKYGKKVTKDLENLALETKAQIKRTNTVVSEMVTDPVLNGKGKAFNYYTGK